MGPLIKSLRDFMQRGWRRLETVNSESNDNCKVCYFSALPTVCRSLITGQMAGGRGFEPRLMGPEPIVLPLNDPPVEPLIWGKLGELSREKQEFAAEGLQVL
jgi:hypothetical protein